ncbi:uncharacterized protein PHACADRAFT_208148 [Phanerochaete carnosa HHB-10118-sp]|uniref:Transmembrane protein n=1 Tax=Phanerochaete carnosa (strain HHB-10118-sp) TaxID=650164 RepID=K5WCK3_PHACS|nr:uncharacterized protein PHACADRAFT_208148 [Phanerochaete carnosa HHB-10118-sp]EKM56980.1 hypothetical protein PHACADRAFT_208148 [Phanerochaete carnosa HHB-10118-sp]
MLSVPSAIHLQSSIAAPTAMSKRDDASLSAGQGLHSHTDPLDGSLGPFLATCALIFVVVLAVASVFWGVHRRTRLRILPQQTSDVPTAESRLSLLSVDPGMTLPPNRLRIRSPIQRLRLLRDSSSTIPLWHSPPKTATPGFAVPDIVLSRPSPMPHSPVSPSLTTFAPPSTISVDSLRVPAARCTAAKHSPKPTPPVSLVPPSDATSQPQPQPQFPLRPRTQPLAAHQPLKQIKAGSPAKKASPAKSPKRVRKAGILGKENQRPQAQTKANHTRKIFGSRDDTWSQIL